MNSYFFQHVHDLVVTAATTNINSHNNTFLHESVLRNLVEEIDIGDEDSFLYFYTKFVILCGSIFIATFNGVKSAVKKYRSRRILK